MGSLPDYIIRVAEGDSAGGAGDLAAQLPRLQSSGLFCAGLL
jgi:hypothetical protein